MSKPQTELKRNQDFHEIDQQCYLQTFKRYPIVLDRGKGAKVWDVEGKEYIDALAGIAVTNVGHSHPTVVKALQAQVEKLTHISNFYLSVPQVELSNDYLHSQVWIASFSAIVVLNLSKAPLK